MTGEFGRAETHSAAFDVSSISVNSEDWKLIDVSRTVWGYNDRWYVLGDLSVLECSETYGIVTQEDWRSFYEEVERLRGLPTGFFGVYRLASVMAKLDPIAASRALTLVEMDNMDSSLKDILEGKEKVGLFPGSAQEHMLYGFPDRARKRYEEFGDQAWESNKKYTEWLKRESPDQYFTLLAALSDISVEKTAGLMERSDFTLAREGLQHYRARAGDNRHQIRPLISHLAALKKLTPVFERVFQNSQ